MEVPDRPINLHEENAQLKALLKQSPPNRPPPISLYRPNHEKTKADAEKLVYKKDTNNISVHIFPPIKSTTPSNCNSQPVQNAAVIVMRCCFVCVEVFLVNQIRKVNTLSPPKKTSGKQPFPALARSGKHSFPLVIKFFPSAPATTAPAMPHTAVTCSQCPTSEHPPVPTVATATNSPPRPQSPHS